MIEHTLTVERKDRITSMGRMGNGVAEVRVELTCLASEAAVAAGELRLIADRLEQMATDGEPLGSNGKLFGIGYPGVKSGVETTGRE